MTEFQTVSKSELQSVEGGVAAPIAFMAGFVGGVVVGGAIMVAGYKTGQWLASDGK